MSDSSTTEQEQTAPEPEPARIHGCLVVDSLGQQVLHVPRSEYAAVAKRLLADGYEMCVDLTAVDYLLMPNRTLPAGIAGERFEVVVNLLSLQHRTRLRMRVQVPEADATLPTLFDLHPGTEAMEREAYDMFGIVFTNHPDLTRILMPEDWDGHPLRKDYDQGRIPVQFSADYSADAGSRPS